MQSLSTKPEMFEILSKKKSNDDGLYSGLEFRRKPFNKIHLNFLRNYDIEKWPVMNKEEQYEKGE